MSTPDLFHPVAMVRGHGERPVDEDRFAWDSTVFDL
jgi:hypothetical protein